MAIRSMDGLTFLWLSCWSEQANGQHGAACAIT